ncbi:multicopper oxidase domain-containing protein [Paenibacillus sp. MBLB4367]|uniref:multicopper oxidase domain-containing protein n=1 Tax=Paenibacillus sp. MBLB4367 TaxID=3384767 RepID=UPI003907FE4D
MGDKVSRRNLLKMGAVGAAAFVGSTLLNPGSWFQRPVQAMDNHDAHKALKEMEGDILRVKFLNQSSHPHSIHFHGMHPTDMDGV